MQTSEAFRMLDVGAASGDMGGAVLERYPDARVVSIDYKVDHLAHALPPRVCADAFDLPFLNRSFDFVYCSLFLHHFDNAQVVALLQEFSRVARRQIIVSDLERSLVSYWFLPATRWIFGWDQVTLHDGPVSIAAAFRADELHTLATEAGLRNIRVRTHRPAFRLSMVATPQIYCRVTLSKALKALFVLIVLVVAATLPANSPSTGARRSQPVCPMGEAVKRK
ncbi:MAG: methyltransferase domain-containing protein [Bryobacteraceae bacterium]